MSGIMLAIAGHPCLSFMDKQLTGKFPLSGAEFRPSGSRRIRPRGPDRADARAPGVRGCE